MPARDLIDRFGREEDAFLQTEFIAPVAAGGKIRVRIAGIVCELSVKGEGFCVLRPKSHRQAQVVREATLAERKRYLEIFPRARLVASIRYGGLWFGLPSATPERGAKVEGLAPIALGKNLQLFDTAVVRFDGSLFLLESTERPALASYLRDELKKKTPVEALKKSGLNAAERQAYAWQLQIAEELAKSAEERRLARALELSGGTLDRFEDRHDVFTVTFRVDGESYTSTVSKSDLTVISSGVCLSGRDRDFDLTTLVSVLRERRREGHDD